MPPTGCRLQAGGNPPAFFCFLEACQRYRLSPKSPCLSPPPDAGFVLDRPRDILLETSCRHVIPSAVQPL